MTWPVRDPLTPLAVLIGQAEQDAREELAAARLTPRGPASYSLIRRHGLRLVLEVPVDGATATPLPARPTRPAPVAAYRPCGTHAAFTRHKNRGETPCDECVEGERDYQAARYERRKVSA